MCDKVKEMFAGNMRAKVKAYVLVSGRMCFPYSVVTCVLCFAFLSPFCCVLVAYIPYSHRGLTTIKYANAVMSCVNRVVCQISVSDFKEQRVFYEHFHV